MKEEEEEEEEEEEVKIAGGECGLWKRWRKRRYNG